LYLLVDQRYLSGSPRAVAHGLVVLEHGLDLHGSFSEERKHLVLSACFADDGFFRYDGLLKNVKIFQAELILDRV
jgi:hypothetical protein